MSHRPHAVRMNVQTKSIEKSQFKTPVETLRLAVTSGIDDYDMICDTILALMPLIPENLYLELDDYIDITNEWWDQNANELLTFNDKHYLVSGDAIITDDDYTYLLLFNKEMYANNSDLSGRDAFCRRLYGGSGAAAQQRHRWRAARPRHHPAGAVRLDCRV